MNIKNIISGIVLLILLSMVLLNGDIIAGLIDTISTALSGAIRTLQNKT